MRPGFPKYVLSFTFLAAVISAARANDLKIVFLTRLPNGNTYTNTRYYKGERIRAEWRDQATWESGVTTYGPPRSTIWQCDAQRVLDLNLKSREYSLSQLNGECQNTRVQQLPAAKGTIDVYLDRVDTGERRQILGRTARHIITHQRQVASPQACWHDAELDEDGWYIELPQSEVARKLRGHSENADVMTTGANCRDEIRVHQTGVERPGLAAKLVRTWRSSSVQPDGTAKEHTSRWETEITELSDAPLDASLFDLPAGFTQVAKVDGQPEMPFSVAVHYWWQRAVKTVRSWF